MDIPSYNIDIKDIKGYCDQKCSFTYNYSNTPCLAKNMSDYLLFTFDESNYYPVLYNSINYRIVDMKIYSWSLHTYNGSRKAGEIIIQHVPVTGGNSLYVCIPIRASNANTSSSQLLNQIITNAARLIPSKGTSSVLNVTNFNLTTFLNKKPFFSYTASGPNPSPLTGASSKMDFVVFSTEDHYCDLFSGDLITLQKIIKQVDIKIQPISTIELFYNKVGAGLNIKNDEIYIDCQPINKSEETVEVPINDIPKLVDDNTLQMIYYVTIFVVIALAFFVGLFLLGNSMTSVRSIVKSVTPNT